MELAIATASDLETLASDDAISRSLARATSLEDLTALDAQLAAFAKYAQAQKATISELNRITAGRLRAQRKAGGCLLAIERQEGGRPKRGNVRQPESRFVSAIRHAGISEGTAYRWQSYAHVPEPVFEGWMLETDREGNEITAAALLLLSRHYLGRPVKVRAPHQFLQAQHADMKKRERDVELSAAVRHAFELPPGDGHVVRLAFWSVQLEEFTQHAAALALVYGTSNVSETVRMALRRQYDAIVKGEPSENPRVELGSHGERAGAVADRPLALRAKGQEA